MVGDYGRVYVMCRGAPRAALERAHRRVYARGRGGGLDGRLVSVLLAQLEQDAEILPVSVEHGVTVDESLVDTQMTEKLPRLLRLLPEAG